MIHHSALIHPKAHVDITCKIGAGTNIRQFASVTRGTVLGEDCNVWPFVNLDGPVFGDRCKIASGVVMGPGFKIGNDVFIGPNVVFCNDRFPNVSIEGFDEELLRSGVYTITVGDGTAIGAGAVILPGVTIGRCCLIAAGVVLANSVGDYCLVNEVGSDTIRPGLNAKRMRILTEKA